MVMSDTPFVAAFNDKHSKARWCGYRLDRAGEVGRVVCSPLAGLLRYIQTRDTAATLSIVIERPFCPFAGYAHQLGRASVGLLSQARLAPSLPATEYNTCALRV